MVRPWVWGVRTVRRGLKFHRVYLDRAADVYLDEWVKIRLFLYLGITQRQDTSASKPAFSYDPAHLPVTGTGEKLR